MRSVTEEQRRQAPARSRGCGTGGLRIFAAGAALLVGQRSMKDILLLATCCSGKSLATHPCSIYQMGSKPINISAR